MVDTLICGIDIGSSKIATVVGMDSTETEELKIIGFNTTPARGVRKGLVVDIKEATKAVEESVEKAERMAGHKIDRAFVAVGGPHISSLNSHGIVAVSNPQGEISEEDVTRVIEAAKAISLSSTRRIIEVIPRDYIVDGQSGIKNPVGMSGVRLEVETHIITASTTNLKNQERILSDLGIENEGFVFSGLASAEAVLSNTEKELGIVLVDIGGGKIDFSIYADGALSYSSSIPLGARHISNDIAVGLRVSLDSAEKIKIFLSKNLGKNISNSNEKKKAPQINLKELDLPEDLTDVSLKTLVDGIVAPRLEEIFKLIFEEIEKSGFGQQIPSGLVITGGGALTIGMLETGKRVVGLPIRIGYPEKVSGLVDEVIDPQYSTTVGLLLYGKNNIIVDKDNFKNFGKILKDFKLGNSIGNLKIFFKQFIP
ncbi:cell division protein FtsA [Candidatus Gracilibacteria bacterium]|uniref:Cell division protein FtsA n=3 Tax=Candidatus Roizmaniibacteriota TaxID=1752723 RepID=A0A2M7AVD3_9BACT|nr:cell division protein FtsA [Candidatus Gracilibacteria bacterium]PIU37095.1 MAG: cell division protein FtsA [Candidatus Roizmanbacteria bacterium CG07_land_8_20_14_0_80_34_15]PIU74581.1 MAG: cell division protein FtsA [Candidatus Roizmanbacteria bacterium CG06_land_8_20_14_3_00_34_14]PIW73244.1 MAG: cell division protein FtsA [Candidatus Roizmanbacteria bacterium CG_4_8_14_3_um_filter_34_9]